MDNELPAKTEPAEPGRGASQSTLVVNSSPGRDRTPLLIMLNEEFDSVRLERFFLSNDIFNS